MPVRPLSRRHFIAGAAATGVAATLGKAAGVVLGDQHVEALVIGSGFGGAVSALRLGRAGVRTVVLERGQSWPRSALLPTFSSEQLPDGRAFWFQRTARFPSLLAETPILPYAGVMDASVAGSGMEVFRAAAVGGGSIVYTGVCVLPRREYFEAVFPAGIRYDAIASTYAPRVRAMLRFSVLPDSLYRGLTWTHSRLWDKQAARAGFTTRRVPSIFSWTVCQKELSLLNRPSATIGESNFGNSNGAKYDLTQNYLPAARATGYVTVEPLTVVKAVGREPDGRYAVQVEKIDPWGNVRQRKVWYADRLVLAAGSMGTSELLVRARDTGALPGLNDEVGEGWGTNGDTLTFRALNGDTGIAQAAPCASEFHDTTYGVPTTMQSWYIPHPADHTGLVSLGMAVDTEHRGRFSYDTARDAVDLSWDANWDAEIIDTHRRINARVADASGAVTGYPVFRPDVVADFTAHPLGGAVIGKATDLFGRVRGYPGLYVNDGALLPGTNGAANPSLMIASLAERNIERVIATDF